MCSGCVIDHKKDRTSESSRLTSCAAYGALSAAARITDAAVVMHGPRSCAYLMSSSHNETIIKDRNVHGAASTQAVGNIYSTDMDDAVSIFGGAELLRNSIDLAIEGDYKAVFVVTTCVSGIIGDNAVDIVDECAVKYPDTEFFLLNADGNIAGDYKDGFIMAVDEMTSTIDASVMPVQGHVNLIGTSFFRFRRKQNDRFIQDMFRNFDITVNCKFIDDCSLSDIRNFCKGSVDILISDDGDTLRMESAICDRVGKREFLTLPTGMNETESFISRLGEILNKKDVADKMIGSMKDRYETEMNKHKKILKGKRVIVAGSPYSDLDWSLEMIHDLEMKVLKIGTTVPRRDKSEFVDTRYSDAIVRCYSLSKLEKDIEELKPDIVIGDLFQIADMDTKWMFLLGKETGVDTVIDYARRMANIIRLPAREKWKEAGL